jgi:hypothetical protein
VLLKCELGFTKGPSWGPPTTRTKVKPAKGRNGRYLKVGWIGLRGARMIIREWRGRAIPPKADAYPKHFHDKVVPDLRQVPGFVSAELSRRQLDDRLSF